MNVGTSVASRGRTPFLQAAGLVAQREVTTKLRSKAFVISTALFIGLMFAAVLFVNLGSKLFDEDTTVGVTSDSRTAFEGAEGFEAVEFGTADEVRAAVEDGEVSAGVVPGTGPSGLIVLGDREAPSDVMRQLSIAPELELLDPNAPDPFLTYLIGIGFGVVFFSSAITFGTTIAQSVVEEKQSRIVEIMLATVPARAILAGKVAGNSILAFGQIVLIAVAMLIAGTITGSDLFLDGLGMSIVWFIALFTVGFVMLAALYAAAASLVSRAEDLGSSTSPLMILIIIPYVMVISFNNNPQVLQVMSYVPFSAPVAVPMRVYLGTLEWWEPILALAILVATTIVAILFAARVYERSLLKTGSIVKWRDALKP